MLMGSPTTETAQIRVWDLPLRLFHWLLVAAIAAAFLSTGESSPLYQWHMPSGWVAAVLIVFRLVWGFVGGEHARFSEMFNSGGLGHHIGEMLRFKPQPALGHNPLGWISALLLLAVSAATIWTGAQIILRRNEAFEEIHEITGWSLLALVGIHVAAVVLMSALTRESLVGSMVTGRKNAARHADARDARQPGFAAIIIALAAAGGFAWGVKTLDPKAFVPRTTEAAEGYVEGPSAGAVNERAGDLAQDD
jgi:cytochrome b